MSHPLFDTLSARAEGRCELCGAPPTQVHEVPPADATNPDRCALVCDTCAAQLSGDQELDATHWFCLQESAWSEHAAVQVLAWRLLGKLSGQSWATDLRDQMYLDDETMAWAKQGADEGEARPKTVDSNGTELFDGDSVTLIKDLDVKGAGFTAKRGTLVKNIRLGDDPELIEGSVNKVGIFLKTCFLKKVS